jgi:hypothetical protein
MSDSDTQGWRLLASVNKTATNVIALASIIGTVASASKNIWSRVSQRVRERRGAEIVITTDDKRGEESCEAVLYHVSLMAPHLRLPFARLVGIRQDRMSLLIPSVNRSIVLDGGIEIRVTKISMTEYLVTTATSKDRKMYNNMHISIRARSFEEACAFIERTRAQFNAVVAADEVMRNCTPCHYKYEDTELYKEMPMPPEKFETLFLPNIEKIKAKVEAFRTSEARHAEMGMRYKDAYMLHSIPGCGKTSIGPAIAKALGRHLLTVPLGKVKTIDDLIRLLDFFDGEFHKLGKCVVTFEDADTWEPMTQKRLSPSSSSSESSLLWTAEAEERRANLKQKNDLGMLLNTLDGPNSNHGQVFIFTTNLIDCFDDALIRPGRMHTIELQRLDADCVSRYYKLHFGTMPGAEVIDHVKNFPPTLAQLSELLKTGDASLVSDGLLQLHLHF